MPSPGSLWLAVNLFGDCAESAVSSIGPLSTRLLQRVSGLFECFTLDLGRVVIHVRPPSRTCSGPGCALTKHNYRTHVPH